MPLTWRLCSTDWEVLGKHCCALRSVYSMPLTTSWYFLMRSRGMFTQSECCETLFLRSPLPAPTVRNLICIGPAQYTQYTACLDASMSFIYSCSDSGDETSKTKASEYPITDPSWRHLCSRLPCEPSERRRVCLPIAESFASPSWRTKTHYSGKPVNSKIYLSLL
jgi:hypothetical protein